MYIFTDEKGNLIEVKDFHGVGSEALKYRAKLDRKLGKVVIAWCHMGSSNPNPEFVGEDN